MRLALTYMMAVVALFLSSGTSAAESMPDILGIRPGMPARDAHAKLQAELPKQKIETMSDTLPTIDKPVIKQFSSAPVDQASGRETDKVTVSVTLPPDKQVVWRVVRQHSFANKGIPKTTLLASLREKYGKETLTNISQGKPATDDSKIQDILWLFDEQGHPAPLSSSSGGKEPDFATSQKLTACTSGSWDAQLNALEVYADLYKGNNPQTDWCYAHFTGVYAVLTESAVSELYSQMQVVSVSFPLALHASEATLKWKKDIAAGQHKQDIDKAKQQEKPKL